MALGRDAADMRRRAEEALRVKTGLVEPPLSELDTQKLLHELQVHQIELEMQNDELKHAQAETDAALARYTDLYDFAPVGYLTLNGVGEIVKINLLGAQLLGQERASLMGCRLAGFVGDTDLVVFSGFLQQVFTAKSKQSCEVTLMSESQQPRIVSIEATLSIDGLECRALLIDVTERKNIENQLRQSQRMEAVGQLTGGIAHDFNNLMAVMIGNAELLKLKSGEDRRSQVCVDAIIRAVKRGSSLTNRLLSFSRQQTLLPVATNVADSIDNLADMLQRSLGETIGLKSIHAPDLWLATIDAHQFENALVNLALNARDAMPKGGVLTIETANVTLDNTYAKQNEEVAQGDCVKVAVSDTGTGMTTDVLKKVFEPFFTTKGVGEGSGLGLSMVYGFAKQSNGHVTIDSEEGHGTTINLYVPRSLEDIIIDDTEREVQEFAPGIERILVVEDDEDVREISVNILIERGYEVVEAGAGKEAIKHLNGGQHFDLLFTDVVLPGGMNGVEIAEQAKQLQQNIKVLYTTGYAKDAIADNAKLGADASVINKPYRRARLLEEVRIVLDRYSILLMEDSEHLLKSLTEGLELSNFNVTPATGSIEGLKLLKSRPFDIIVSDIVMEDGEGIEALLWATENIPDTPVIMISGFPIYLKGAVKFGAATILPKPFKIEVLVERIRTVISGNEITS